MVLVGHCLHPLLAEAFDSLWPSGVEQRFQRLGREFVIALIKLRASAPGEDVHAGWSPPATLPVHPFRLAGDPTAVRQRAQVASDGS